MKAKWFVITALLYLSACSSAPEKEQSVQSPDSGDGSSVSSTIIVPIYSQRLVFQVPDNWKVASEVGNDQEYLLMFVPANETDAVWSNAFFVNGLKGLAGQISPEQIIERIAFSMNNSFCQDNVVFGKLGATNFGNYPAYQAIISCSSAVEDNLSGLKKGQSAQSFYVVIQGEQDIYIVRKAIRGAAFDKTEPPLNGENVGAFMQPVAPLQLCRNEGAPEQCIQ